MLSHLHFRLANPGCWASPHPCPSFAFNPFRHTFPHRITKEYHKMLRTISFSLLVHGFAAAAVAATMPTSAKKKRNRKVFDLKFK